MHSRTISLDRLIFLLEQARDKHIGQEQEAVAYLYESGNISIRTPKGELLAFIDIYNEDVKHHDPAIAGRVKRTRGSAARGQVEQIDD